MGLFRPYEQGKTERETTRKRNSARTVLTDEPPKDEPRTRNLTPTTPVAEPSEPTDDAAPADRRKSAPTRSRKEAELARHATMRPKTKAEWRKVEREARWAKRDAAMAAVEKQPERKLARDYVDSRRSILEFAMPIMLLLVVMTFFIQQFPQFYFGLLVVSYALLISIIIESFWRWRGFKKLLAQRHPNSTPRGLMMYMVGRMSTFRRFRNPAPEVAVGDKI